MSNFESTHNELASTTLDTLRFRAVSHHTGVSHVSIKDPNGHPTTIVLCIAGISSVVDFCTNAIARAARDGIVEWQPDLLFDVSRVSRVGRPEIAGLDWSSMTLMDLLTVAVASGFELSVWRSPDDSPAAVCIIGHGSGVHMAQRILRYPPSQDTTLN